MELTKNLTQTKLIKSLVVVILGSIALTISAKIKIPFYPVPMTMQTFVVLFLGISLGHKIALATVGLYLIEGIVGVPEKTGKPIIPSNKYRETVNNPSLQPKATPMKSTTNVCMVIGTG